MAEEPADSNSPAPSNGGGGSGGQGTPAAVAPQPQDSVLSLSQLIGAPISALIDAEAQSAMATARFIRNVGFSGDGTSLDEFGDLRMATFTRRRRNGDTFEDVKVEIPLLTMLPIPAMQIKDAQLDYTVRVLQTEAIHQEKKGEIVETRMTPDGEPCARLRASFAREVSQGDKRTTDMLVKMKVRIEQADMPDGLAKLLALSSESLTQEAQVSIEDQSSASGESTDD